MLQQQTFWRGPAAGEAGHRRNEFASVLTGMEDMAVCHCSVSCGAYTRRMREGFWRASQSSLAANLGLRLDNPGLESEQILSVGVRFAELVYATATTYMCGTFRFR